MNQVSSFSSECSICLCCVGAEGAGHSSGVNNGRHSSGVPCCKCKQLFHKECLKYWYKRQLKNGNKVSCPNCRFTHIIDIPCQSGCFFKQHFKFKRNQIQLPMWEYRTPSVRIQIRPPQPIRLPPRVREDHFLDYVARFSESERGMKMIGIFIFVMTGITIILLIVSLI